MLKKILSLLSMPDVVNNITNTIGNVIKSNNETKQKKIESVENMRKAELNSQDHAINKNTEVANSAIDNSTHTVNKNAEVTHSAIENSTHTVNKNTEVAHTAVGNSTNSVNKMSEVAQNTLDNSNDMMNKMSEVTHDTLENSYNTVNKNTEVVNNAINQTSEIAKESMSNSSNLTNNIVKNSKDIIEYSNKDKKNIMDFAKVYYDKLSELKDYRHQAEIETTHYRTKEETLNEISKNISIYAESLIDIDKKIQNLELEIESKKKKIENDKQIFEKFKQEWIVEEARYQDLTNEFNILIESIEKLSEYKYSMTKEEYSKNITREKRTLQKYIDKIESIELKLLNIEKEKLIIDKKLKPKLYEIEKLELSLKYFKNERDNNKFKGLLKLSNIQIDNPLMLNEKIDNEIMDVEIETN